PAVPTNKRASWFPVRKPLQLTWTIDVETPGNYRASLAYSAAVDATPYELLVNGAPAGEGVLGHTDGYFGDQQPLRNFAMFAHPFPIALKAGRQQLSLHIEAEGTPPPVGFCELQLTPEAGLAALAAEEARAMAARAALNWFQNSRYGLMFHWTSQTQPRHGALKPYAQAVADFDVDAFADRVAGTGAAYVMFTANHAEPTFPAPLPYWESLYPGWTTERDLVAEMIEALRARGIKLFLYLNLFVAYRDFGRNADADDFVDTSCRLLEEIGEHYGKRLSGYWIDSCHQLFSRYGSVPMGPIFRATKTGNLGRVTCFNWGIRPVGTPWQEFWSAETVMPGTLPPADKNGRMLSGPGKGLNGHALLIMDDFWVHKEPDTTIADPRWSSEELIEFIRDCNEKKAPVTINLAIYQDGSIGPGTAEVMDEIRSALR
ncbi:MAG: hypothetical protein HN742_39515, partial [Lentisphaerae bacterium]|nr:hypothetical protein [Lentisphaerota bacterium]